MLVGPKFEPVRPPPTLADILEPVREYDDVGIPLHTIPEAVFRLVEAFRNLLEQYNEQTSVLEESVQTVDLLLDRNAYLHRQIAAVEKALVDVGCSCDCSCPANDHGPDCGRERDCTVCVVVGALARARAEAAP